ncbi:MAG: translesion error-prone DNA polymerase V subunit UmuC, partial [Gammaproteobacteria bacterium]
IVLSNNDGCVVARSQEAKALGIGMAVPAYQIRELIEREGVAVFSSNYALYADISQRVMCVLEELAPRVEQYSIDEAFLDLSGLADPTRLARTLRDRVHRWVGVPVSVGLAPTRTLAKLANAAAKRWPATGGVVDLRDRARQRRLLRLMEVEEIWGVGRRLGRRLRGMGIDTALKLADSDVALMRKAFSINMERTIRELRGQPCLELEEAPPPRQQVLCSRTFAERVSALEPLREAVSHFAARTAEKLREDGQQARQVSVYLRTNPHNPHEPQHHPCVTVPLPEPADDSRDIIHAALQALEQAWRPGHRYMKAGVLLGELVQAGTWQRDLFDHLPARRRPDALMQTLDRINRSGRGRLFFASEGIRRPW